MPTVLDEPIAAVAESHAAVSQVDRKYAELIKLDYPIELIKEGGQFTATFPDLPGCVSFGDTPDEAVSELEAVKALWIRGQLEGGNSVPLPSSYEDKFSGKFIVRIPKALHRSLHMEAEQQGVSLNQYVNYALANRRHAEDRSEIDYTLIAERVLAGLREAISAKTKYLGHAPEASRRFHFQSPPGNFEKIGFLVKPGDFVRHSTKALSASSKKNYREAHFGY